MPLDLHLRNLPVPHVGMHLLANASRMLQETTRRNHEKAAQGYESVHRKNAKEEMKRRLVGRRPSDTFEQATAMVGRQRLLLSLYLEYAARSDAGWLPAFDEAVARSVLGESGRDWHGGRRRQATSLFFTHFDRLHVAGLSRLCARLVESYDRLESNEQGDVEMWRQHRRVLFTPPGPQGVARSALANETLPVLMTRFAIPTAGRFTECLRQVFLLNALRFAPFGGEVPALAEIETVRSERASSSQLMGAAALQIMVQRVAVEGKRRWSGEWPKWITRLGCDPRYGRANAEGARWWNWATDDELRLAQQGLTGLTLRSFIELLRQSLAGETGEGQFRKRAAFLLSLETANKVRDARVIVSEPIYLRISQTLRTAGSLARFEDSSQEAKAIICLACADEVFVIEGTHNFGLRAFHKQFPLPDFWTNPRRSYRRAQLVVPRFQCPIFLTHGQRGGWVSDFFAQLRSSFHVEWNDIRL